MRNGTLWFAVLAMGLVINGCQSQDENPNWNSATDFPDWTYDKPVYTEPAVEPQPYEKVANGIDVYYSRSDSVYIRRPGGKQPDVRPRTAVWYSYDGGNTWQKDGYYGLHQLFYTFYAEQDGQYWIRFVGPNMGVAEVPPGQPHEIHVVDTQAPTITLQVDPPPFEDVYVDAEGNEVPCPPKSPCCYKKIRRQHLYQVGEKVIVSWTVSDVNLEPKTIELSTCFARFPHNLVWSRFKGDLDPTGTLEVVVPPEAATQAGMRFRMIAHDKASNIGMGLSEIMDVQTTGAMETPETPEEPAAVTEAESREKVMAVEETPAEPTEKAPADTADLPEPTAIQKPKAKAAPLGLPEPPADLTEPVNIETPASKPAEETPTTQGAISKPTPLVALTETPPAENKTEPTPVVKAEPTSVVKPETPKAPEPPAVEPTPVEKAEPTPVVKPETPKAPEPPAVEPTDVEKAELTPVKKAQPVKADKSTRSETSLAAMEREMEQAKKAEEAAKPAATPEKEPAPAVEAPKSVPVKVLAQAPAESKPALDWKPVPPSKKTEPASMKLSDIPEKVQQGWPARDMTMQGGVSRLLNWLPESAAGYKAMELQFSSNNGKSWITVASDLMLHRVATWTVPMVTSQTCLLRIVGTDADGGQKTLETSDSFSVDAGKWETIDMSGFKMQVPKSK